MNIHFPHDIQLTTQFRRLSKSCGGDMQARYLLDCFFTELGLQAQQFKVRVGLFERRQALDWNEGLGFDALGRLVDAGYLVQIEGDWWCKMFAELHPELDPEYVSPEDRIAHEYRRRRASAEKQFVKASAEMPPGSWLKPDGTRLAPEEMRKAFILIKILDRGCRAPERKGPEFTPGLVQSAMAVVSSYEPPQLSLVLERLLGVMARCDNPRVPKHTEGILAQFDTVVAEIRPDMRLVNWDGLKKTP